MERSKYINLYFQNSDPCQTQSQLDAPFALDGITQNVATDVYKTVLESLTKGYMVCQLSYMLLVANGEGVL